VKILDTDGLLSYDPRVGFLLNSTGQTVMEDNEMETDVEYRCFTGTDTPTTSAEHVVVKLEPLPRKTLEIIIWIHTPMRSSSNMYKYFLYLTISFIKSKYKENFRFEHWNIQPVRSLLFKRPQLYEPVFYEHFYKQSHGNAVAYELSFAGKTVRAPRL